MARAGRIRSGAVVNLAFIVGARWSPDDDELAAFVPAANERGWTYIILDGQDATALYDHLQARCTNNEKMVD